MSIVALLTIYLEPRHVRNHVHKLRISKWKTEILRAMIDRGGWTHPWDIKESAWKQEITGLRDSRMIFGYWLRSTKDWIHKSGSVFGFSPSLEYSKSTNRTAPRTLTDHHARLSPPNPRCCIHRNSLPSMFKPPPFNFECFRSKEVLFCMWLAKIHHLQSRMMEKDFMTSLPRDVIEKLANIPRQSLPTTPILSENEGNSGPFPSLQFNERDQFVDVRPGTAHEFRPPGPNDVCGPPSFKLRPANTDPANSYAVLAQV